MTPLKHLPACSLIALSILLTQQSRTEEMSKLIDLSLEELMQVVVTTASRTEESIGLSPAFIEVVSFDEIRRRGYRDLSHLLDDIAGIQITRAYSDNFFTTMWRGIRHTIGSSHLLLIDGVKFNHLYNNDAEILAALPLSNIKQIEIVHGSASVAFGADAVAGVINIITNKEKNNSNLFFHIGENGTEAIDLTHRIAWDDYTIKMTARYDEGRLDFSNASNYHWTNPELLQDKRIWGNFVDIYGKQKSSHYNKALHISLYDDKSEIVAQYYEIATGYGFKYTFDSVLPNAGLWREPEYSVHWKNQYQLNENLTLDTLIRHRKSNITNDSFFVESYLTTNPDTEDTERVIDTSYWESKNESSTISVETGWDISTAWTIHSGIEAEFKKLQKAYNTRFGPALPPELIDINTYDYPSRPTTNLVPNNKIKTNQKSLFLLSKYQLSPPAPDYNQTLHFGVRNDRHSEYNSKTTIRAGYVGQWDKFVFKLFYGEAYQEPPARLLYGGWQGSGSDPDLNPRDADTLEFTLMYQQKNFLFSANFYQMNSKNLFTTTEMGAINLGKGEHKGVDLRARYQNQLANGSKLDVWGTYSWMDSKEQSPIGQNNLEWYRVGDIAENVLHFGANYELTNQWLMNLRGRYYDERPTVSTNEIRKVSSYLTLDGNITYKPDIDTPLYLSLAISNLLDKDYFHPGLRSASATTDYSSAFDENNVWIGSDSFYNSLIPQSGRELRLTAYWKF